MAKYIVPVLKTGIIGLAFSLAVLVYRLIDNDPEPRLINVIYVYMCFAIVVLLIVALFSRRR